MKFLDNAYPVKMFSIAKIVMMLDVSAVTIIKLLQ